MADTPADLLEDMDAAARELLKSITGHTIGDGSTDDKAQSVAMESKIEAFEAVTAYLAVKHKVQPSGAGKNGIDRYRDRINGGASGGRARSKGASASNGAAPSPEASGED